MEKFIEETEDQKRFKEVDVKGDGSCMYRSIIRFMVDKQKFINKNPYFHKIFYRRDLNEREAAKSLQKEIKNWIVEHATEPLDTFINIEGDLQDLLLIDHEEIDSLETYDMLYDIFSGDVDYIEEETGEFNKKGEAIMKKMYIPTRWGGITELYAFHKMFNITIHQWVCKRWNKKNKYVENSSLKMKDKRYLLIQTIGDDINQHQNNIKISLHLLYQDSDKSYKRHYLYLRE
jgi:hypothetical protein